MHISTMKGRQTAKMQASTRKQMGTTQRKTTEGLSAGPAPTTSPTHILGYITQTHAHTQRYAGLPTCVRIKSNTQGVLQMSTDESSSTGTLCAKGAPFPYFVCAPRELHNSPTSCVRHQRARTPDQAHNENRVHNLRPTSICEQQTDQPTCRHSQTNRPSS